MRAREYGDKRRTGFSLGLLPLHFFVMSGFGHHPSASAVYHRETFGPPIFSAPMFHVKQRIGDR